MVFIRAIKSYKPQGLVVVVYILSNKKISIGEP